MILDVRSVAALQLDPRQLPGALRVDLADLRSQAASLPRNRDIVVYCNCPNEASAAMAAGVLAAAGFTRARPLAGGVDEWERAGRPLELHAAADGGQ